MRPIKFRAWYKELSKFNDNFGIYFLPYTDLNNTVTENIILMQYTGLKDKNGVEIYEGDIVQGGRITASIVFNPEKAMFAMKHPTENLWQEIYILCEVIGNIYENPELIKEDN